MRPRHMGQMNAYVARECASRWIILEYIAESWIRNASGGTLKCIAFASIGAATDLEDLALALPVALRFIATNRWVSMGSIIPPNWFFFLKVSG